MRKNLSQQPANPKNKGNIKSFTSTITLIEVLVQSLKKGNKPLAAKYKVILLNSKNMDTREEKRNGWMMGVEPTATWATTRCSNRAELHPPFSLIYIYLYKISRTFWHFLGSDPNYSLADQHNHYRHFLAQFQCFSSFFYFKFRDELYLQF